MPKETFFNLPEEKRGKIVEAALTEFEHYNFDSASINRIIENSDISKGSFYQYFENKKDLYKYIIKRAVDEKIKYISASLLNPLDHDFFTIIRDMYDSGLRFAKDNPRLVGISKRLLSDKEHPVYKEIMNENMGTSYQIFESLLQVAIERGEVRDNIDKPFIAYLISSLLTLVVEYYQKNVNQEFSEEIMITLNKFLEFLEFGIGTHNKEGARDD